MSNAKKTSIIWNVTRLCSWTCKFCCVNAEFISNLEQVNINKDVNYCYKTELSFSDKIKIIDQLTHNKYTIDFSGGEILIDPLNVELVLYASKKLGADSVGISTSGVFITDEVINKLSGNVRDVEITLDYLPFRPYKLRTVGYHEYAAYAINRLITHGFTVGVQTVLTKENISKNIILEIFDWLEKNKVDSWSLLRFFPSGRGSKYNRLVPSYDEYCNIVEYISQLSKNSNLKVHFQYLLPNHSGYNEECRAVKKSIGILPDGSVTACFWALDENMLPRDDIFYLGKLPQDNIDNILNSEKANYWKNQKHHCKIFDFGSETENLRVSTLK